MKTDNSTKPRDYRLEAYQYLKENPKGFRDELVEAITIDIFREFRNVGIISEGMDGNWRERYRVTSSGKERIDSILNIEALTEELLAIARTEPNFKE